MFALALSGGLLCSMGQEKPCYEAEKAEILAELNEYRGAYNEYALSLSCGYELAQEIAYVAHGTLEMKEDAEFGTLRLEDRMAEELIESGDVDAYIPYLSPEFYLYPTNVEGGFSDMYAGENDGYLYSRIGLGENGEVRALTKGSTERHTARVVMIDTGIDYDHEEFVDEAGNPLISKLSYSVGHGMTVEEGGWEIIDDVGDVKKAHGTMVAGSIFARGDNGKGIVGLAEDVELIVIKMPLTASGGYEIDSFLSALDYCLTLENVDVVNMSLGFFYSENPFSSRLSRLKRQGAVIVSAGGNEARTDAHYPSADPNVIGVGAFEDLSNKQGASYGTASYSAFGDVNVNIVAPGKFRTTCIDNGYSVENGTSLATPVVVSAIALYRSMYPDATPDEIMERLYASADDQGLAGKDYTFGYGGLNIHRFLTGELGSVTFHFGTSTKAHTFMIGTPLNEYPFPDVLPQGKSFGGWYLDPACTQPVSYYTAVLEDGATLYAKWEDSPSDGAYDYAFDGKGNVYLKGYYGRVERLILPTALTVAGREFPVVGISARAFQKSAIKRLIVQSGIQKVEEYAFAGNAFDYLYLPSSLTSVGKYAVMSSSGTVYTAGAVGTAFQTDWNISSEIIARQNAGVFTVEKGMALLGNAERTLLFYEGESEALNLVSEGGEIVAVAENALAGSGITSISMPNVTTVDDGAFANAKNLAKVEASALITVGRGAFENCAALTTFALPQTLESIGSRAFANCVQLVRLNVAEGIKLSEIGEEAFSGCASLEALDLTAAEALRKIDMRAFENCTSIFLVSLPQNLETVASGIFTGCNQIVSLRVPFLGNGASSRTHIGFLFGYSYSTSQQVPLTLRYVFVTRENLAADALSGLSGLTVLANGRNLGTAGENKVYTSGAFAQLEIRYGDMLCGLLGGMEGESLSAETLEGAYFTPAGYTVSLPETPKTLTSGTLQVQAAPVMYTVRFYDGDRLLSEQTYSYGETVIRPQPPVRESTAQYSYEFIGWGAPVTLAVQDATYTAQFREALRSYTVSFLDEDDSLIYRETYDYGALPAPPAMADRYSTDAHYYDKFIGWDEEIVAVTGDATYTAVYERTARSYTVTFRYDSAEGTVFATVTAEYGTLPALPETSRPADRVYSYTFLRWESEIVEVTGDVTYVALYEKSYVEYTVRFLNWDGSVLKTQSLHYGELPTPPADDPSREADEENEYVFIGWGNVTTVTGDADYTAQYRSESLLVTITFLNYDGSIIEEQHVSRGSEITPPNAPVRESNNPAYRWEFTGWSPAVTAATADAIYTARFTQVYLEFTVKFMDWDGTLLSEQVLRYGASVSAPSVPTREADERYTYVFAGWDSEITAVDDDKIYTATYTATAILYTVRFLGKDGELIEEKEYEYGATVTPPTPPTPEGYEFTGWDKEISAVTGNAEYRARYKEIETPRPDPPHTERGCMSVISAGGGIMAGLFLVGAVCILRKRKNDQ